MSENERYCPPNCPKRSVGCHSSCESYQSRCKENERINAEKHRLSIVCGYARENHVRTVKHMREKARVGKKNIKELL